MVTDFYDVGIIGTSLYSHNIINKGIKTIFIEPSNNYGTTYNSINELSESTYLKSLNVVKQNKEGKLLIESMPIFIKSGNDVVERFKQKPYSGEVEYVKISNLYFLEKNGSLMKLWTTKNDIVNTDLMNNLERFHFAFGINKGDLSDFKKYIIEDCQSELLHKIFVKWNIFNEHIIKNFEKAIYLYPVYGITSLCENISLINSISGATYLLSKSLAINEQIDNGDYKYMASCEYGNIYIKDIVQSNLTNQECYVKVLWMKNWRLMGDFLIFLEGEDDIINIYGVGSEAKVCEEGTELIYIVKANSVLKNTEFEALRINNEDILLELDFITKYDVKHF